ncbi:restriction endonuclease [Catellatospora paridis]|uniref:restriction endonuclease n=1 Tax=Catellatospora paridis TaxID=1617086 RepID=UPI0012D3D370|nr:restriction endonuclease [Catellatospora paridis]
MAKRSPSAAEYHRRQQAQAKEAARQQRAAENAVKATQRAERENYLASRGREADNKTHEVQQRMLSLQSLLEVGLRRSARIDLVSLKKAPESPPFASGAVGVPAQRPSWEMFAPSRPGVIKSVLEGRTRQEQRELAARQQYEAAQRAWEQSEHVRLERLAALRREHLGLLAAKQQAADAHNRAIDELASGVRSRRKDAVEKYLQTVLRRMPLPAVFARRSDVIYSPHAEQVVVRLQLPSRDVVPVVKGYSYIQSKDELRPAPRPAKEVAELYRATIAQVALLVTRDLFDADPMLREVGFNGHVDTVDPATGQSVYPCLISLTVDRDRFSSLNLRQVNPEDCLRHLNALVSQHPYELKGITPVLDFDRTKYAFVEGMDAVAMLDSRPDLMQLSAGEFEHLVRQVFEAMGMQGWTTTPSKDDGVDGVVFNPTPFVGGLTIVQAKRYKDVVGVNHIRELAGAMEEKKAGHGVLVTTSWFTTGGWQKARDHGRIELVDGPRLVHLIKEHLGKDVLIGIKRPKTASTGPS